MVTWKQYVATGTVPDAVDRAAFKAISETLEVILKDFKCSEGNGTCKRERREMTRGKELLVHLSERLSDYNETLMNIVTVHLRYYREKL